MRKTLITLFTVLLAAAATLGVAGTASAQSAPITLDHTHVQPGDTVHITGRSGPEALNWVASKAFVRQPHDPYPGEGGSAVITSHHDGHFAGHATIVDVPPGTYDVSVRIGGGNAGSVPITVTG